MIKLKVIVIGFVTNCCNSDKLNNIKMIKEDKLILKENEKKI